MPSFPFPIKMIAKLLRIQSIAKQNMEQTQNPTMGAMINNKSYQQNCHLSKPLGSLNAFYWYKILALDSVVV